MRRKGLVLTITLALALTVLIIGSAWAEVPNPYISSVISSTGAFSDTLTAKVTQVGSVYKYEYTLDFLSSYASKPLSTFSIGNMSNLLFTDAGNDQGLTNPIYGVTSPTSIIWTSGNVAVGKSIKFWFLSPYSYQETNMTLFAGRTATGTTLGLNPVPEPGSLASLCAGLLGLGGIFSRARFNKK